MYRTLSRSSLLLRMTQSFRRFTTRSTIRKTQKSLLKEQKLHKLLEQEMRHRLLRQKELEQNLQQAMHRLQELDPSQQQTLMLQEMEQQRPPQLTPEQLHTLKRVLPRTESR